MNAGTQEVVARTTPQQTNGYDCGVYVTCIAEWICTRGVAGAELAGPGAEAQMMRDLTPAAIVSKRAEIRDIILQLSTG
jgi:Ulp1 family protease